MGNYYFSSNLILRYLLLGLLSVALFCARLVTASESSSDHDIRHRRSLAILIDSVHNEAYASDIAQFQSSMRHQEGFEVHLILGTTQQHAKVWKKAITQLYERDPTLEGLLLVGNIPEVYLELEGRKLRSDRYYEDLFEEDYLILDEGIGTLESATFRVNLENRRLRTGSTRPSPHFYSARIPTSYLERLGGTGIFQRLSLREKQPLQHLITFRAASSRDPASDCLNVWREEVKRYREWFPQCQQSPGTLHAFHHQMGDEYIRTRIKSIYQGRYGRNALTVVNQPLSMAVSNALEPSAALLVCETESGETPDDFVKWWARGEELRTIMRLSRPKPGEKATELAAFEGSKIECLGLLNLGLNIGQIFKAYANWGDQLFGDPTLRYVSVLPSEWTFDNPLLSERNFQNDFQDYFEDPAIWRHWLNQGMLMENPYVLCLAMRRLSALGAEVSLSDEQILQIFRTSNWTLVRFAAMDLLAQRRSPSLTTIAKEALTQREELLTWYGAAMIADRAQPKLLLPSMEAYFSIPHQTRSRLTLKQAFRSYSRKELADAAEIALKNLGFEYSEQELRLLLTALEN